MVPGLVLECVPITTWFGLGRECILGWGGGGAQKAHGLRSPEDECESELCHLL